ncbi:unnamed protein product [Sphenostylis stenocarpa]|uniref:Uncharacterized protein n=1 Tax=Sphenostylis stenocarpa TaxID=92480 RepID=A0AA86S2A3_9FABA|nr:unnamed protein product [Sphenostylis stenocarpa]
MICMFCQLLDTTLETQSHSELLPAVRLLVSKDHCDGRFVFGLDMNHQLTKQSSLRTYNSVLLSFNGLNFAGQPCSSKKLAEKSAAAEALLWLKGDSHSFDDIDHASVLLKKSNKKSRKKSLSGAKWSLSALRRLPWMDLLIGLYTEEEFVQLKAMVPLIQGSSAIIPVASVQSH